MKVGHEELSLIPLFLLLFPALGWPVKKVIYGDDDRFEASMALDPVLRETAQATAAMIPRRYIRRRLFTKTYRLRGKSLMQKRRLCHGERFASQPAPAQCSGFLIAPQRLVTAGHCVTSKKDCRRNRWVFGLTLDSVKGKKRPIFPKRNVYECKRVLVQSFKKGDHADYAVIELDRVVEGRRGLKLNLQTKISWSARLAVVGHPSGLPMKVASSTKIMSNSHPKFFRTDLDAYGGNSGSPVVNLDSGKVEGILINGDRDYKFNGIMNCYESRVCHSWSSCAGEGVMRISEVPLTF